MRADVGRQGRGKRDYLRAVNELALVDPEERKAAHDVRERLRKLLLVVSERLPLARRARVTREQMVGLQAHLAAEGGRHLALDAALTGEGLSAELGLDEELGVEDFRS